MLFLKRPTKKFKFKKDEIKKINELKKKKKYLKQQNINLSTLNENSILNLQNKIGNKQTLILLRELGDLGVLQDEEIMNEILGEGELFPNLNKNEHMETLREIKNFKKLSRMNTFTSSQAVRSGRFTVNHNKFEKPDLNKHELAKNYRGLMAMVIYFRGYDPRKDKSREKVEVDEKLIDPEDKEIRSEIDILMKMIGRLPDLNEREENIEAYMKVLNFLVSTGCDLEELFKNNGNVNAQKKIIFEALRGKDPNRLVPEDPT